MQKIDRKNESLCVKNSLHMPENEQNYWFFTNG